MTIIKCSLCGEDTERDEFGMDPAHIAACKGRQSALHYKIDLDEKLRSTKAQRYGKKGSF